MNAKIMFANFIHQNKIKLKVNEGFDIIVSLPRYTNRPK